MIKRQITTVSIPTVEFKKAMQEYNRTFNVGTSEMLTNSYLKNREFVKILKKYEE